MRKLKLKNKTQTSLETIQNVIQRLNAYKSTFDQKRNRYIIILKSNYDKKITDDANKKFKVGDSVAYYVGDRSNVVYLVSV